jgi:DNA excision repair protein ERCC-4
MTSIQQALLRILDSMLKQVQRNQKLDSTELNICNALSRNFDATIRHQLDPVWNTVSQVTQSLIKDIRTIQELLRYLLRFNCVSFLRYLQCLKAAAGPRTEWMLHSAANTVFQVRWCTFSAPRFHICEQNGDSSILVLLRLRSGTTEGRESQKV